MNTEPTVIDAHKSHVNDVLFTSDSQYLLSAGMDNIVQVWSIPDWEKVKTIKGHSKSVNSLSLTDDDTILATGSTDKTLKLWSFPEGAEIKSIDKAAESAIITPDGKYVATTFNNRIQMRSVDRGEIFFTVEEHKRKAHTFDFSPDGELIATGGLDENILIWEVPSKRDKGTIPAHPKGVMDLKFSPDGRYLASTGYEGTLKIWSTQQWGRIQTIELEGSGVFALAVSPDSSTLAVTVTYTVYLIDAANGHLKKSLKVNPKGVYKLDFSPDGKWLAVAAADGKVRVWDVTE